MPLPSDLPLLDPHAVDKRRGNTRQLEMLRESLSDRIKRCRLCEGLNVTGKTESAPGFGNSSSRVMIIGQSLCTKCMFTQIPFTGGSGRVLDRAFQLAGVKKTDVFITNVVHCHTPNNRPSRLYEIENCRGFLIEELMLVRPNTVIPLGQDAVISMLGNDAWPDSVGKRVVLNPYSVYPMYHPSYLLRKGENDVRSYVDAFANILRQSI